MLIAYLSIANIMTCWSLLIYIIGTPDFVCYFGIAELFHTWANIALKYSPLVFFKTDLSLIDSIKTLCFTNRMIFDVFTIAAISLSGFKCLDLYLSFKNPFQQGKYRMKWYIAGTLVLMVLMGPNTHSMLISPNDLFDTYMLPFFYLDPAYQKRFKKPSDEDGYEGRDDDDNDGYGDEGDDKEEDGYGDEGGDDGYGNEGGED